MSESRVWRLGPAARWLDRTSLAGGAPFRVVTLTPAGAQAVRDLIGTSVGAYDPEVTQLFQRLRAAGLLLSPAPKAADHVEATVVIPARSTVGAVALLLDRIGPDISVIVVDDGSLEPLAVLADDRVNVRVLRHPVSRGPGAARNTGAAQVSTPWIAFLDVDTEPDPRWIEQLKGRIDDDAAAVGAGTPVVLAAPRLYPLEGSGWGGWFEHRVCALDLGGSPSEVGIGRRVSYVPSAAMLVDAVAFRRCRGFNEDMQVGEDVDLVWRMAEFGRVSYWPDVRVGHQPRGSLRAALVRRAEYGTSAADLSRKHPGSLRHVDVSVLCFCPWVLGVLVHPLLGVAAAGLMTAIAPMMMPNLSSANARKLALQTHLHAFGSLGRWLVRPMAPGTILLALAVPAVRRRLGLAVLCGLAQRIGAEAQSTRDETAGALSAVRSTGEVLLARSLDDLAYSAGVWMGVIRRRTVQPVLPRIRGLSLPHLVLLRGGRRG